MAISDSRDEVAKLYDAAHAFKQKAKAMKARLDAEDAKQAEIERKAAEDAVRKATEARASTAKRELDDRVRKAMVAAAQAMKAAGVVFKGPETSFASRQYMPKLKVVDVKTGKVVELHINSMGFEWD